MNFIYTYTVIAYRSALIGFVIILIFKLLKKLQNYRHSIFSRLVNFFISELIY